MPHHQQHGQTVRPSFTLADLISNVGCEEVRTPSPSVLHPQLQGQALSNLAALAKLEQQWGTDTGSVGRQSLLLPEIHSSHLSRSLSNLGSDSGVSPGTHSLLSPGTGSHSLMSPCGGPALSPVLGCSSLAVPGSGYYSRGASPISPIDSLMRSTSGHISPLPPQLLRAQLTANTGQQRPVRFYKVMGMVSYKKISFFK